MAKKRVTLPKDFEALLKNGSIEELKAIFDKCGIDARGGYAKQTALAFDECPHELAGWLVEQGADLQARDTWKNTPLHSRSRSIFGNIKSLLELGADVNDQHASIGTPLHSAANAHNIENTKLLLAFGANADIRNSSGLNPLELTLRVCSNIDIENTVELVKIYLDTGLTITPKMKEFTKDIGKQFEFHRAGFNSEYVDQVSDALDELYRIIGVEPVAKRAMHDGKSPISAHSKRWQEQHQEFWELLVPSSGAAQTMQGEVIRITGRISNELNGNGGVNWDADFKKMADTFLLFIKQGKPLKPSDLEEAAEIVAQIKRTAGDTSRMAELGVKWVLENPTPVKLPALSYKR